MVFVDTNYFLRFLLNDVSDQHASARQLFEDGARGVRQLCTSLVVMFEVYWVLSSFSVKAVPRRRGRSREF